MTSNRKTPGRSRVLDKEGTWLLPVEVRNRVQKLFAKQGLHVIEQFTNSTYTRYSVLAINHAKQVFWWVGGRNGDDKLEPVTLRESVRIYSDERLHSYEGTYERSHLKTWLMLVHRKLRDLARAESVGAK